MKISVFFWNSLRRSLFYWKFKTHKFWATKSRIKYRIVEFVGRMSRERNKNHSFGLLFKSFLLIFNLFLSFKHFVVIDIFPQSWTFLLLSQMEILQKSLKSRDFIQSFLTDLILVIVHTTTWTSGTTLWTVWTCVWTFSWTSGWGGSRAQFHQFGSVRLRQGPGAPYGHCRFLNITDIEGSTSFDISKTG